MKKSNGKKRVCLQQFLVSFYLLLNLVTIQRTKRSGFGRIVRLSLSNAMMLCHVMLCDEAKWER